MEKVQTFNWAECELTRYRKGFITVRFDFERRVLIWKDSNQWFHNFVRALGEGSMNGIREEILRFLNELEDEDEQMSETTQSSWSLSLGRKDEEDPYLTKVGHNTDSTAWRRLARIIEESSRCALE